MRLTIIAVFALALCCPAPAHAGTVTDVRGGAGLDLTQANITGHYSEDGNDTIRTQPGKKAPIGVDRGIPVCQVIDQSQFTVTAVNSSCDNLAPGELAFPVLLTPTIAPPAGPTAADITAVVRDYVRTLSMPVPKPQMSASEGITGARHSLDLHTQASRAFPNENTSFGQLKATAHGSFTVDWGDGTKGTYSTTGAPWPNSNITHFWTTRGTYNISVIASWSVDWSLGGYSGVITGLQTTGTINNWPVIEAQAVIVH